MNISKRGGAAIVATVSISALAHAATINWQLGPVFNGPNGHLAIDSNGTLLQAVNTGDGGTLTVDPGGLNISFSATSALLNQGVFSSGSPGSSDANWNTIINRTDWNIDNFTSPSFLTGLEAGRQYQVQLFASDARGCCSTRTQFFSDGMGNDSPTFTQGTFTSIIGTFTADGPTQAIGFSASSTDPILNAFVLRDLTPAPVADQVGNPLVNAPIQDTANGSIFVNSESFAQTGGSIDTWGFYDDNTPGRQITPLLLSKSGAQWEIVGVGTTRTSTGGGAQNHDFGLVSGSDATGPGVFLGWKDGSNGGNNLGVPEWTNGGPGWVEWFGGGQTSFSPGDNKGTALFLNRTYSLTGTTTGGAPGEVVGNPLGNRGTTDGASGSIFVMPDGFTLDDPGAKLSQWAIFTNQTAGRQITPLILAPTGSGFEIVGVGTTRTVTNDGVQLFDFDLIDGSDLAMEGLFFGWKDGGQGVNNQGVPEWTNGGPSSPSSIIWLGSGHTIFGAGDSYGISGIFNRTYSLQAFTRVDVIPEPATFGLVALSGAMILRRRGRTD